MRGYKSVVWVLFSALFISMCLTIAPTRAQTLPFPTRGDAPPDFTSAQGYRAAAPYGVGIDAAWAYAGGRGDGVTFVDLEYAWNFDHADYDLDLDDLLAGGVYTEFGFVHGTAVMGIVVGADNGFGITGLAPHATAKVASSQDGSPESVAQRIRDVTPLLPAGSVLLIEQQTYAPFDVSAACVIQPCAGFVPMEIHEPVFDAIQAATASGIIVVELAGNGGLNLNHPVFNGQFNPTVRDSGAILVSAGDPLTRQPYLWSNTGKRVDAYAWGGAIYTTGYGDVYENGTDDNHDYTANFAGSSGASAIVSGAAVSLQGIARAQGGVFTPAQLRALLRSTGTPQGARGRNIGVMPNLAYALRRYFNTDGNRLLNVGFEDGTTGWKIMSTGGDGVMCKAGLSAVGACAFRFKGNVGEKSKLRQPVIFAPGDIQAGDIVTLSFSVLADDAVSDGLARLRLVYTDGTTGDAQTSFTPTGGAYAPQSLAVTAEKPVQSARVLFTYRGITGKVFLDDVTLFIVNGSS